MFDRAAERIVLIDEQAREIPPDTALHLLVGLVAQALRRARAGSCCPRTSRASAEQIAARHGAEVVRAGITQAGLIEAAADDGRRVRGLARRRLHLPRRPARASTR